MNNYSDLYFLTLIANYLADCLDENQLAILAGDLTALADLLAGAAFRAKGGQSTSDGKA